MREKEPQKPPEHTSEHVKSQNFSGASSQTPLAQSIVWAPLFVFALGPHNPLGSLAYARKGASKAPHNTLQSM